MRGRIFSMLSASSPMLIAPVASIRRMIEPVSALGRSFRRDIAALVNRGQREKLLAGLQRVGDWHGTIAGEIEAVMTLFPQTQPEAR